MTPIHGRPSEIRTQTLTDFESAPSAVGVRAHDLVDVDGLEPPKPEGTRSTVARNCRSATRPNWR